MSDFEAPDNSLYAVPKWWDGEFKKCKKNDIYEWYTGSDDPDFIEMLCKSIPSLDSHILHLGCGISRIQETLFDHGYKNITNCDVSPSCIQLMSESDTRGMKWEIVNLLEKFPYDDSSFDFELDKATLDALITEKADKWTLDEEALEISEKYFSEIHRVLKPGGVFVQITFGQPHFRKRLFERDIYNWTVDVITIEPKKSFHFFMYICKKNQ
ncbi:endothelin-converting enzyme 2-like protein [Tritrichomonas foetus]|uniref:Endothelin-converting enzyme 2-like protein n=1 Tax=Tritrichomonas foetus TaxID=1144522 RepID=A0A1J4KH89_9EUKA|nr:endothelin-converting enzyme 2-like protein [Tritrichomonas foetus]|eukprot:OHT10721.1 endothelin-converting enzyme 2-like protein [Tritrichomonas foetus]